MKSAILNPKKTQIISKFEKKDKKNIDSNQLIDKQIQSSPQNTEDSLFNNRIRKKSKTINETSNKENSKIESSKNENSKIEMIKDTTNEKDINLIEKQSKINESNSSITSSNNDEESIYSEDSELDAQEIQFKKAYYLGNIALRLNNTEEAIHYADDLVLFANKALTKDQMRVFLGCNNIYIEKLRNAHRILCNLLLDDKSSKKLINEIKIEKEKLILKRCDRIIKLINENILNQKLNDEETAKYLKLKGDYYRYMAEITTGHLLFINKQNAFHNYNEARDLVKNLDDLNATKLNISLNYSVFLNEILNMRINSFFYAKEALYNALKSLKNCSEEVLTSEDMKDTLMIIETLNNNVEDWYKEEVGDIFDFEQKELEKKNNLEKKPKKEKIRKESEIINENINNKNNNNEEINKIEINKNIRDNNLKSGIINLKNQKQSQIFQKSQKS